MNKKLQLLGSSAWNYKEISSKTLLNFFGVSFIIQILSGRQLDKGPNIFSLSSEKFFFCGPANFEEILIYRYQDQLFLHSFCLWDMALLLQFWIIDFFVFSINYFLTFIFSPIFFFMNHCCSFELLIHVMKIL